MQILFEALGFGEGDRLGGSVRVAAAHARGLAAAGHQIEFVCTNRRDKGCVLYASSKSRSCGQVRVHYLETHMLPAWPGEFGPHYVRCDHRFREALARAEVAHLHEFRSFLAAKTAREAFRRGIPVVMQPQGTLPRHDRGQWLKSIFDRLWGGQMIKRINAWIAATPMEADIIQDAGVASSRIHVVPNGLDCQRLLPLPPAGEFRRRHPRIGHKPMILCVGRVQPVKGHDLAIAALARMQHRDAILVLAGPDADYRTTMERLAQSEGVSERVVFTGALPEARDILSAMVDADLFLLPSRFEAFGMVILEAALAGKAMVLSRGCHSAPAFEGRCALLAPPDGPAFAACLDQLLADQTLRVRFEETAPLLVRDYDLAKVVSQLLTIYHSTQSAAQ